jgi:LysM repeat protein
MKMFREVFGGLLFALLAAMLVLGALTVSLVEGQSGPLLLVQPTETPFELPTIQPGRTILTSATVAPITSTPSATATITCPQPAGWMEYVVQYGDDLGELARKVNLSTDELINANCLLSMELVPGTVLFLPQTSQTVTNTLTPSATAVKCGPPAGWIQYRIQSQDTLFRISLNYGVSVPQLQYANCMGSSTFLRVGELLYVPNVATRTPSPSATVVGTNAPTQTSIIETATETPTPTSTPTLESTAATEGYPAP